MAFPVPFPPLPHLSRAIWAPLLTLSLGFGLLLGLVLSSLALSYLSRPPSSSSTSSSSPPHILLALLPVRSSALARFSVRLTVTASTMLLLSVPSFVLMYRVRDLYLLEDELQQFLPMSHAFYVALGAALIGAWYLGFVYLVLCSFSEDAGPLSLLPPSFRKNWKSRGKAARRVDRLKRKEKREAAEQQALLKKKYWEVSAVRQRLGLTPLTGNRNEDDDEDSEDNAYDSES